MASDNTVLENAYLFLLLYNFATFYIGFYAYDKINAVRDRVIFGVQNGTTMSLEHRWLMLRNDWLPAKFGIAIVYLAVTLVGAAFISEATLSPLAHVAWVFSAILPASAATAFLGLGILDLWFMVSVLRASRFES